MITEYAEIESILLREGLRAFEYCECSVELAAMGERVRKNRHRVQEQRAGSPKVTNPRRIPHVLRKICRQKLDHAVIVAGDPTGVPQSESRAISEAFILKAIGHFESEAADANRMPRIVAELAQHMTLLHRNFGQGHRIAASLGGRGGLGEMLAVQLVFLGGEIGRGDGAMDVDKRAILFGHMTQGALIRADRLTIC